MPKKAPAHRQNEPLDPKALRSTKDKFISKDKAQKVSGDQRNSKLGQEEEKHLREREKKRHPIKSYQQ